MILRLATPGDVPALVALARSSFTDAFGELYAPENLATFLDTERAPQKVVASIADPDTGVMLAENAGGLIGYCTVYFNRGFAERPAPQPKRPCLLSQLYCDSRATRQGVGAALIEWAIGEARERACDAMQLSVFSENFGAQKFYARYGFEQVADIDFWVGDHRDDEFLYELALT